MPDLTPYLPILTGAAKALSFGYGLQLVITNATAIARLTINEVCLIPGILGKTCRWMIFGGILIHFGL